VLRGADLVIVPVIPSPLSRRALDEVLAFLDRNGLRRAAVLPVYNMVDRRRTMHRAALDAEPGWPIRADGERGRGMATYREPVGAFRPSARRRPRPCPGSGPG
jgi:hypothetical protein